MKNISLKAKILFLSAFMVTTATTIGVVSYIYLHKTTAAFKTIVETDAPAVRAVDNMLLDYRYARIELLQLTSNGTTAEADAESIKIIKQQWQKFDTHNKDYLAVSNDAPEDEKKIYNDFIKGITVVRELFDKAIALYEKNSSENSPERAEMAKVVVSEIPRASLPVREASIKLNDLQAEQIRESSAIAFAAANTGNLVSILVTIIGSLIGLATAFIFSTKLSRQMNHIIDLISTSSREVAAASTQIAHSSDGLSEASTEQAASLGETAASLEEITAMISKASESAVATERSSTESQTKAEEGRRAVDQMLSSIEEISRSNEEIVTQVNNSNQQMTEIVRVIQEIGTKTKIINEIVFQTKLLSFNASVEAARAGEHGKGFAVVAEEVGNLAQMSGNAAKEISDMLDGSISKVESIVRESKSKVESLVESGKQKIEVGVGVARQCSGVLDEIVNNVTRVSSLAQEISQASREQSLGVGEINKAMHQLDSVTQQNSATSEQAASAADQLSNQAISLKSAVDELVVTVQGGTSNESTNTAHNSTSKIKPSYAESKKSTPKMNGKKQASVIPIGEASKKKQKTIPSATDSDSATAGREMKMASGESLTPSRDNTGFDE